MFHAENSPEKNPAPHQLPRKRPGVPCWAPRGAAAFAPPRGAAAPSREPTAAAPAAEARLEAPPPQKTSDLVGYPLVNIQKNMENHGKSPFLGLGQL